MTFTPATAALLVRANGGTDEEAIFLASVMPGESGGDPDIVNTHASCGQANGLILHAVGLFQICDYPSRGTRAQLRNPDHNAREALKILRSQSRAAWTATPDPDAADEARRALAGGTPMETWHPRAIHAGANRGGSSFIGVPTKLVLHTIETPADTLYEYNSVSYFGNSFWPHATIDSQGIHQHLGIDGSAFALYHASGRVDTNLANAVQCEIMGQAAHINDIPEETWGHLADWLGWCAVQTSTPITFADFRGDGAYGENAPQRFSDDEWLAFSGICGHQHVPQNDHWDPGAIDTVKLARLILTVDPTQEDDLTTDEHETLYATKDMTKATNEAVGRIEVAIRDQTSGIGAKLDQMIELLSQK